MASVGVDEYAPTADEATVLRELGRYRLLALVGRGGMGDIFLAMSHGELGFKKLVVIKCLRAGAEESESMRRMFLDEGELAARLTHPHVVQTYEVGEAAGLQYMAMEYLDGQPLSKIRRSVQPLDQRIAAKIAADGLGGLHYAHELKDFTGASLNIVHRDLSPPNIFVTYDGVVKLVDFGIAKTTLASRAMTEVGVLKGKIGYMAPEHVSRNSVDRRADIFAMGVVLWELLAHRRLVTEKAPVAALKFLLYGEFAPPSSVRPEVDPELDRIVLRALQRRVDDRYSTALEMRTELEAYLERSGPAVRNEDLARLMNDRFADRRQKRGLEIREWIAAAEAGDLPAEASREAIGSTLDSDPRAPSAVEARASSGPRKIALQYTGSMGPHVTTEALPPKQPKAWGRGIRIAAAVLVPCAAWAVFFFYAGQRSAEPPLKTRMSVAPMTAVVPELPSRRDPAPAAPIIEPKEAPIEPAVVASASVDPKPRPAPMHETRSRSSPSVPSASASASATSSIKGPPPGSTPKGPEDAKTLVPSGEENRPQELVR
jgi:serine/threonine-protein kinase